jgi:putative addiction module killer protein
MLEVRTTAEFDAWLARLADAIGKARIIVRIKRLAAGNSGDVRPIGHGLSELRIDSGPGYRVYFARRGNTYVLLLAGGDKRSQKRDIARAHLINSAYED